MLIKAALQSKVLRELSLPGPELKPFAEREEALTRTPPSGPSSQPFLISRKQTKLKVIQLSVKGTGLPGSMAGSTPARADGAGVPIQGIHCLLVTLGDKVNFSVCTTGVLMPGLEVAASTRDRVCKVLGTGPRKLPPYCHHHNTPRTHHTPPTHTLRLHLPSPYILLGKS